MHSSVQWFFITSVSTTDGNFRQNDYHFWGRGQNELCIPYNLFKRFLSLLVSNPPPPPPPHQDSHMQIICGNPGYYRPIHCLKFLSLNAIIYLLVILTPISSKLSLRNEAKTSALLKKCLQLSFNVLKIFKILPVATISLGIH